MSVAPGILCAATIAAGVTNACTFVFSARRWNETWDSGGDCAPHPFVLSDVYSPQRRFRAGEDFCFSVTLVGKAAEWLGFVTAAVALAAERGLGRERTRFRLVEVGAADGGGRRLTISPAICTGPVPVLRAEKLGRPPAGPVALEFVTPLRLQREGKPVKDLNFPLIVKRLTERVGMLCELYCAHDTPAHELRSRWQELVTEGRMVAREIPWRTAEERWADLKHYSAWQRRKIALGGVVERIEQGEGWQILWPLLAVGEFVHVGKSTSFGCGQYRLVAL